MLELAMQMLFCLLVAAILGGIIGYILGRMSKCDEDSIVPKAPLYDYNEAELEKTTLHKEVFASLPDATIKKANIGIKPITLASPKGGKKDNLKEITGIGLSIENGLYALGIYHFWQIAQWSEDNITWIDNHFSHKGRVEREEWISQAKRLSKDAEISH